MLIDGFDTASEAAELLIERLPARLIKSASELLENSEFSPSCNEQKSRFVGSFKGKGEIFALAELFSDHWETSCTCGARKICPHAVALLITIADAPDLILPFPELSTIDQAKTRQPVKSKPAKTSGITQEQHHFLGQLRRLLNAVSTDGRLKYWDLTDLGLRWSGPGWEYFKIAPAKPRDEFQLWNFLVAYAVKRCLPLPEFMQPLTNLETVSTELRRMEQEESIQRWNEIFHRAELEPKIESESELLLVLRDQMFSWHIRVTEQGPLKPLSQADARRLLHDSDSFCLSPKSEEVLDVCRKFFEYELPRQLDPLDNEGNAALAAILSRPRLRDAVTAERGVPFQWHQEPLHLRVEPPPNREGDYVVRLALAKGEPPPACRFLLAGKQSFYLTDTEVFPCGLLPDVITGSLPPWTIPVKALESPAGIRFLESLNAHFPEALEQRISRILLRLVFVCELRQGAFYDPSECLSVTAFAEDDQGKLLEFYAAASWNPLPASSPKRESKSRESRVIIYERNQTRRVAGLLATLPLKFDSPSRGWQMRVTKNFPEAFVTWIHSLPPEIDVHLDPALATLMEQPIQASVGLDCAEAGIDWFDLQVVLNVSDTKLTKEELKLLLNARGRYVRLPGKGWRRLEYNLTEEQDSKLARLGLSARDFSAEPQRLHALQLADDGASELLPAKQIEAIRKRAHEIKTRVTPDVPPDVHGQLRPYQVEGFHFLAYLATNRFGGILADDMGLGKTLQTLTWLIWSRRQNGNGSKPALVVCPKSVMDNWKTEASRFAPSLRVQIVHPSELSQATGSFTKHDLVVLNYSQLRGLHDTLSAVHWHAVILDEGQYIKNPDSQTAQAARALKSEYRLVLSGTPIENRLLDLWSLMSFAMPGVLGNRSGFNKTFGEKGDLLARSRLAARVRPFLLRRTKAQVASDLPDRIEEDILCELEGEQRMLYRAELKRAQQMLLDVKTAKELNEFRFHFLTSLLRLRQICCHPGLVNEKLLKADSAKLEALVDLLEPLMEEGNKVLVFSQFVSMLQLIKKSVIDRGWNYFFLAGDTEDRGALVEQFQTSKGAAVFLISLKAGGFGLNLTAASYVVLFDPWWNPAVENQAIDRTHRIGQVNKVIAYRLLVKDSIEGKIRALQKQKSALAHDILGEESFGSSLTIDDLKFLFSGDLE